MTNPQCCNYAKCYIVLEYGTYYIYNKNYFVENKPYWIIRGCKMEDGKILKYHEFRKICFCPSCGTKLPDIKLKSKLPKKL